MMISLSFSTSCNSSRIVRARFDAGAAVKAEGSQEMDRVYLKPRVTLGWERY